MAPDTRRRIYCATTESVNTPETPGANSLQDWYVCGPFRTEVGSNEHQHECFHPQLKPPGEKKRQSQTTLGKYVSNVASRQANKRRARVLLAVLHRLILERQPCIFVSPWASRRFQRWRWEGNTSLLHSHWVNSNNGMCALHHPGTVSSSFTWRSTVHWDITEHVNVTAVGQKKNISRSPINRATSTLYSEGGGKKNEDEEAKSTPTQDSQMFATNCFLYSSAL